MPVCVIDGNIGAGKSTALNELARRGYRTISEDVDNWKPYLERFYADKRRWSFTLQVKILKSMTARRAESDEITFVERSVDSSMVFADIEREHGYVSEAEYDLLMKLKARLTRDQPRVFNVYVHAPIDVCLKRIERRNRSYEKNIGSEYLAHIESKFVALNFETVDGTLSTFNIADEILRRLGVVTNSTNELTKRIDDEPLVAC